MEFHYTPKFADTVVQNSVVLDLANLTNLGAKTKLLFIFYHLIHKKNNFALTWFSVSMGQFVVADLCEYTVFNYLMNLPE